MHLLGAERAHLLTDDVLDLATHLQTQRQPCEHAWSLAPDVARPHEKAVACDLGVYRVFTERTDEELREACWHPPTLPSCGQIDRAGHAPQLRWGAVMSVAASPTRSTIMLTLSAAGSESA